MRLYDTARQAVVPFEPNELVLMYTCGITPYDATHLGHAATFISYDVLQRRLHAAFPNRVAVINAGIGGNQVAGPPEYSPQRPFPGGPAALQRLERDVLTLSGITKAYGGRVLFADATLQVNRQDRIGLVGPNGAGKTTLFSIILGQESADAGQFDCERGISLGHLPQESAPVADETVLELATAITSE